MTKKELRKAAKKSVSDGKSKQETYDALKSGNKISNEDLAKIIQNISSLKTREKHKVMNGVLIIIILLTIFLRVLVEILSYLEEGFQFFPTLIIVINIMFLIGVATYSKGAYIALISLSILGLVFGIIKLFGQEIGTDGILNLAITACILGLSYYLNKNLFPEFSKEKQIYQNNLGQDRLRYIIKFKD